MASSDARHWNATLPLNWLLLSTCSYCNFWHSARAASCPHCHSNSHTHKLTIISNASFQFCKILLLTVYAQQITDRQMRELICPHLSVITSGAFLFVFIRCTNIALLSDRLCLIRFALLVNCSV